MIRTLGMTAAIAVRRGHLFSKQQVTAALPVMSTTFAQPIRFASGSPNPKDKAKVDLYRILGLHKSATLDEIKAVYREMGKLFRTKEMLHFELSLLDEYCCVNHLQPSCTILTLARSRMKLFSQRLRKPTKFFLTL